MPPLLSFTSARENADLLPIPRCLGDKCPEMIIGHLESVIATFQAARP